MGQEVMAGTVRLWFETGGVVLRRRETAGSTE